MHVFFLRNKAKNLRFLDILLTNNSVLKVFLYAFVIIKKNSGTKKNQGDVAFS